MRKERLFKYGSILAAALLGIFLAEAFQAPTDKFGVVDIQKVVDDSDFGKANQDKFKTMKSAREGVLEFVDTYRVLTNEQAQRLRDLSLKDSLTVEERAELDRIKADVMSSSKKSAELVGKPSMSPDEKALVDDYTRRAQQMEQVAKRWYSEFSTDLQKWADDQKAASVDKARSAVQDVAKSQGYTVVFEVGIAPYGANDITDASLKAMNAKK